MHSKFTESSLRGNSSNNRGSHPQPIAASSVLFCDYLSLHQLVFYRQRTMLIPIFAFVSNCMAQNGKAD